MSAEAPNAAGALAADAVFTVRASADDAFVVIASGNKPMSPVLGAAAGADAEITPWAMSGAIWIECRIAFAIRPSGPTSGGNASA